MTDYGHPLTFGSFLTPTAADPDRTVALARVTEQVGLELVGIQDHPYTPELLDAWTILSVIAASTESVRVTLDVANLPFRHPVVLARSVASLDLLTGGRVDLGLGSGAYAEVAEANAIPPQTPGERIEALEESIAIMREIWTPERGGIKFHGKHFSLSGAKRGPIPPHQPRIWLGALKPRMLRLTGRVADGWLMPNSGRFGPDQTEAMNRIVDEAAVSAGRSPADVLRMYNLFAQFGADSGFPRGSQADWVGQLTELTLTQGVSTYLIATDSPDDLRRFADVAAAVREGVAAGRVGDVPTLTPPPTPAGGFELQPTPDDGVRRSDERPWDESERPTGPVRDPNRGYRPEAVAAAQHLVTVHDSLRSELYNLRDLVEQVAAGSMDAGRARSELSTMTMRQNNWELGTYCESYCRFVTMHHGAEDMLLFPHLRRSDPALVPVMDRLQAEHRVIHGVLDRVDAALVALVDGTGDIDGLRNVVDLMTDTLLSHLAYEEREVLEPLARFPLH